MFESIAPRPNDPIMVVMEKCKADTRPEKIDLGIGVYKDEAGHTTILKSVKLAEEMSGRDCLLYTSPSPRDATLSRMPSSA